MERDHKRNKYVRWEEKTEKPKKYEIKWENSAVILKFLNEPTTYMQIVHVHFSVR